MPSLNIKKFLLITLLSSLAANVYASTKPNFLSWNGYATIEDVYNFKGGIKQGNEFDAVAQLQAIINTNKAELWNNGEFTFGMLGIYVTNNQYLFSAMLQSPSNLYAPSSEIRISDLSYQHNFSNKAFFLIGITDLNYHFNVTKSASYLLNDSFDISPILSVNSPVATYPYPGFGAMIDFPTKYVEFLAGIFQGNPQHQYTVFHDGYMVIGELDMHPNFIEPRSNIDYTLKAGVWHYQQNNPSIGNTNNGMYFIGERAWCNGDHEPRSLFIQVGVAPTYANIVQYSVAAGYNINAILPNRPHDVASIGYTQIWVHHEYPEIVWEFEYTIQINKCFALVPDLQFAYHPSGIYNHQAFVGILRLSYTPF